MAHQISLRQSILYSKSIEHFVSSKFSWFGVLKFRKNVLTFRPEFTAQFGAKKIKIGPKDKEVMSVFVLQVNAGFLTIQKLP